MKKKLLSLLLLGGLTLTAGAQQLPNIGFSSWKSSSGSTEAFGTGLMASPKAGEMRQRPGVEPTDWNGSSINQKVMNTTKEQELIYNDNYAVKMVNTYVGALGIGSVAPGFINLGTPWVYASTTLSDCGGGVYGGVSFSHKPDAITGRYKRTDSTGENSHIIVYLWNGTFTSKIGKASNPDQSRNNVDRAILGKVTPTASGTLIASCDYTFTSTTGSDWQTITVPLTYHNTTTTPTMMNTIISAGDYWTRGNMKENTTLLADDVKFVYYSTLKTLTYDGVAQTIPAAGETLDMSSVEYDASKLSYTLNGQTATPELSYDEATGKLTITVSNVDADVDGLSSHTYYVQFATPQSEPDPEPQPEIVSFTDYSDNLVVVINGENTLPQETTINVSKLSDGSYTLSLNDFMLVAGEDILPVGNIVLEGLTATEENGTISFSTNQSILIQPGSSEEDWFGPMLGDVPISLAATIQGGKMKCEIDIDMTGSLGQVINVYFGVLINDENTPLAEAQGVDIVLNRTFPEGWSTLALQYDVTKEALGATRVMTFNGVTQDALLFAEYTEDILDGNYPYLVYFETEKVNPFFVNCNVYEPSGSQTHDDWTFCGTFTGIAAPGMEGKYGVTTAIDGHQYLRRGGATASIKGTRAYFEYFGSQNVQQMRINLDGENGVTSIDGVQVLSGSFDIYNLQGVRVRTAPTSLEGLTPGVYVVNGKKVMVK